ncbi:hypothetical protein SAMN04487988_10819 [Algoriphagus hitonicola]|uniref:Uncharacterized protein n=1 Tax=Algoriphagus hitonicola TaxID=435880 RepID=A0A1I2UM12_9BACT|nr:hypothetical protein SAMN04487988_10819 [Algoriphagus hitonicola]
MGNVKKWELFSGFLAIGVIYSGFFFKSIMISLIVLSFGVLIQIYIFYLYKRNSLVDDYFKKKFGALLAGLLLVGLFLLKNTITF